MRLLRVRYRPPLIPPRHCFAMERKTDRASLAGHRNGMSLPEDLYYSKLPERQGLHLSRGPDPRSHGFHAMMSMPHYNNYEVAM